MLLPGMYQVISTHHVFWRGCVSFVPAFWELLLLYEEVPTGVGVARPAKLLLMLTAVGWGVERRDQLLKSKTYEQRFGRGKLHF